MQTATTSSRWAQTFVTLMLGAVMSAAIWLAGGSEAAYLGFVMAALVREARPGRPGLARRPAR